MFEWKTKTKGSMRVHVQLLAAPFFEWKTKTKGMRTSDITHFMIENVISIGVRFRNTQRNKHNQVECSRLANVSLFSLSSNQHRLQIASPLRNGCWLRGVVSPCCLMIMHIFHYLRFVESSILFQNT